MDFAQLLTGGAILGFLATIWGHFRTILWKVCSLLVQRIELKGNNANAVINYLLVSYKLSSVYDKQYQSISSRIKLDTGHMAGMVPYERIGLRSLLFWNGWKPLLLLGDSDTRTKAPSNGVNPTEVHGVGDGANDEESTTILFLRGTWSIDALIAGAFRMHNEAHWGIQKESRAKSSRFFIDHIPSGDDKSAKHGMGTDIWYREPRNRLLLYNKDQINQPEHPDRTSLGYLYFPPTVTQLIDEIRRWHKSKDWYIRRGIPWKRGWLLFGPPGTGKSALTRAFAEDLDLPIFVLHLGELGNKELSKHWKTVRNHAPCIALIEDFDNVFHGRTNITMQSHGFSMFMGGGRRKKDDKTNLLGGHATVTGPPADDDDTGSDSLGGVTFDCLLNTLDGIERNDGIFTIITTNDISKIDPALGVPRKLLDGSFEFISTRPGRIDKAIELTYMRPEEKRRLAERILAGYPEEHAEILNYIDTCVNNETPAQFQERCSQIALARFWKDQAALLQESS